MRQIKSCYKHYVYRHIRLDVNTPFYIGIGTSSKTGQCSRAYSTNRNIFWKHIVSKTKYKVEIFFETNDYAEAISKEIEFIKLYGRLNRQTGTLCNLTDGGEGFLNVVITDEHRDRCRTRQLGKRLSDNTKKNMSNAQNARYKDNPISPKAIPVFQYSLDGLFIKKWDSATQAAKKLGFNSSKIFDALRKENHYAQENFWLNDYKGMSILPFSNYIRHSGVVKMDMDGNELKRYDSVLAASLDVCGNRTGLNFIKPVCQGKTNSYRNFKWKYYA